MADQGIPPDALQKLATDIANDVAQRISEMLRGLPNVPLGCNPGPFECPSSFQCSAFSGPVKEPQASIASESVRHSQRAKSHGRR